MTRREPDWADEAARGIVEGCPSMVLGHEAMEYAIAAALRAERERCAGIAEAEIEDAPATCCEDFASDTSQVIRDRIRAGDQP